MGADVYLALKLSSSVTEQYGTVVKVRSGLKPEAVAAELQPYFQEFAKQTPDHYPKNGFKKIEFQNLSHWVTSTISKTLYLLFGAVALLLAIGCGNVLLHLQDTGRRIGPEIVIVHGHRIELQNVQFKLRLAELHQCFGESQIDRFAAKAADQNGDFVHVSSHYFD